MLGFSKLLIVDEPNDPSYKPSYCLDGWSERYIVYTTESGYAKKLIKPDSYIDFDLPLRADPITDSDVYKLLQMALPYIDSVPLNHASKDLLAEGSVTVNDQMVYYPEDQYLGAIFKSPNGHGAFLQTSQLSLAPDDPNDLSYLLLEQFNKEIEITDFVRGIEYDSDGNLSPRELNVLDFDKELLS